MSALERLVDALTSEISLSGPLVTEASPERIASQLKLISAERRTELGIRVSGPDPIIGVTDPEKPVGNVSIECKAPDLTIIFDNALANGAPLRATIRVLGENSALYFLGLANGVINLPNVFLRSPAQRLVWGVGATAVNAVIGIEGKSKFAHIGDDCMLSGPVTIRNHDMHTIFDLDTERVLNPAPCDVTLQQHVWVGQSALLFNCDRVGYGTIIGANSVVKSALEPISVYAGSPAKKIRSNASWCRSVHGIAPTTRERLNRLRGYAGAKTFERARDCTFQGTSTLSPTSSVARIA